MTGQWNRCNSLNIKQNVYNKPEMWLKFLQSVPSMSPKHNLELSYIKQVTGLIAPHTYCNHVTTTMAYFLKQSIDV